MKRNQKIWTLVMVSFSVGLQACVSTGSLGIIGKSGVHPADKISSKFKEVGFVEKTGCRFMLAGAIPFGNADIGKVANQAMDKVNADALVNVTTTNSMYGFIPIYNLLALTCTSVRGTAIQWEK